MSTCYPQPGSVRISDRETLTLVSNYSSSRRHIGVMGLFYILVADPLRNSPSSLHHAVKVRFYTLPQSCQLPYSRNDILNIFGSYQMQRETLGSHSSWAKGLIGVVIALSVVVAGYRGCLSPRQSGFERVAI